MKSSVYNTAGESADSIELPDVLFGQKPRVDLLHRVVTVTRNNLRQPIASTKDRRDRAGGGRKPWRQKGTGRARHGSVRSPIWRGGGVTFGPDKERSHKGKVSKTERRQAVVSALSGKHRDGEVLFVDELSFKEPSAAAAREMITNLSGVKGFAPLEDRRKNAALIILPEYDENVALSFRNFGNIAVREAKDISTLDLLTYKYTIIADPEKVLDTLVSRVTAKTA
ncbi:MAG: 50S ribosomal protein L4 [Candidatus Paceibacterota bacterium]